MFVTGPNIFPSCPNFRFPPTSTDLLTIPDIRKCLYRVTFKTWAGPGWFYTAREVLDQMSVPGDSWDFWVILKTNMFFKDIIVFDFVKKKICMSFYYQIQKVEQSWVSLQFTKLPSCFKACALLWKETEKQHRASCLNGVCRSRTTFPPSLSMGQKLLVI